MKKKDYTHIEQSFEPIFNQNSKILILGTMPSVISREKNFYYSNSGNRFWKILANIFHSSIPENINEKIELLLDNGVAVWDVIQSCDIIGSKDSTIKNVVVADIPKLIENTNIIKIYANGKRAAKYYTKYLQDVTGIEIITLLSTSPANRQFSDIEIISDWKKIIE